MDGVFGTKTKPFSAPLPAAELQLMPDWGCITVKPPGRAGAICPARCCRCSPAVASPLPSFHLSASEGGWVSFGPQVLLHRDVVVATSPGGPEPI